MKTLLPLLLLGGCMAVNVDLDLGPSHAPFTEKTVDGDAAEKNKIALLELEGVLRGDGEDNFFSTRESHVVGFVEKLKVVENDPDVKAVIVRIDSPGGDVTTSDILYHELVRFKERKRVPVVAVFMGIAASGGYYVASGADVIVAHPTSITGSIGVISMHVSLAGLLEKIGVKVAALKSGANKDMGSPFRDLTDEDRRLLQSIIDQFYARFLEVVTEGRKGRLSEAEVKALADGRVYTAQQALQAKLVDKVGYLPEAVAEAQSRARLPKARLVMYARKPRKLENPYSATAETPVLAPGADLDQARRLLGFHCYYLWEPYLLGK